MNVYNNELVNGTLEFVPCESAFDCWKAYGDKARDVAYCIEEVYATGEAKVTISGRMGVPYLDLGFYKDVEEAKSVIFTLHNIYLDAIQGKYLTAQ